MRTVRLTIEARDIRPGDRLADSDRARVTDTERVTGLPGFVEGPGSRAELIEIWTEDDFAGMPGLTVSAHSPITVWREVCPDCDGRGGQVCPDEWRTDSDGRRRHLAGGWVVCGTCGGDGVPA